MREFWEAGVTYESFHGQAGVANQSLDWLELRIREFGLAAVAYERV